MMTSIHSSPLASETSLAVIIPTHNRAKTLITCLEHLEQQTWKNFEVIVVDDGSQDETEKAVREFRNQTELHLRFVRQENAGPARARNVGVSLAHSPLVLLLGDDILATPRMIEQHVEFHRDHANQHIAALGLTLWDTSVQKVTRFMKFLEAGQFAYDDLLAGSSASWKHFYTSNLSLKTNVLQQNPFCERFPGAAMEDIELGYRLSRSGALQMRFLPEARAYHVHPTNFYQACKRMRSIGWATHLFHELWPETYSNPKGKTFLTRLLRGFLISSGLLAVASRLCSVLSTFWSPKVLFDLVLNTYVYLGYLDRQAQIAAESSGNSISYNCRRASSRSTQGDINEN